MVRLGFVCCGVAWMVCGGSSVYAQQAPLTWQQVKDKFEAENPTLRAGQINIQESKAQEITAYLRPNPDFTLLTDGTQITRNQGVWQPFTGTQFTFGLSYLHERDHKRELRLESAQKGTGIAESQQADLERTMLFNLRAAFVSTLQAKQVLALARENLAYFDREMEISRNRYKAGDIARVDLDRLELQRVQYESDLETAIVNLRTAKINLLALLNGSHSGGSVRRHRTVRFRRFAAAARRLSLHRLGQPAGFEGGHGGGGQGPNRPQAGGG